MGDRVSISFKDSDQDESPVLFHHWGGTWFPQVALKWITVFNSRIKKQKGRVSDPTSRMESRNMMVQFIGMLNKFETFRECEGFEKDSKGKSDWKKPIRSKIDISHSIYLGKDSNDGDNSDNGHYTIMTNTLKMFDDKDQEIGLEEVKSEHFIFRN